MPDYERSTRIWFAKEFVAPTNGYVYVYGKNYDDTRRCAVLYINKQGVAHFHSEDVYTSSNSSPFPVKKGDIIAYCAGGGYLSTTHGSYIGDHIAVYFLPVRKPA